jgi:hypothetical protein
MSELSNDIKLQFHIDDFTTFEYIKLLRLAKLNYRFVNYEDAELGTRFILWRHDCDFSLNRALRIAQIEHEEGIISTYFINPHCDFYNVLEKGQSELIKKIISLGHRIGLHFDASYYTINSETELEELIAREADWFRQWFNIDLKVFSFHNPTTMIVQCEKSHYGGLINCYSEFFKKHVPYCSDSNGYWRFRRLYEVLEEAQDPCLHILTHPCWWQEKAMLPRARVLRAAKGRAAATMNAYDELLSQYGRNNVR